MAEVAVKMFPEEKKDASKETVRKFVKDMSEISDTIKDKKADLKEAISSNDEITKIDDEIKELRERRKKVIEESAVIQGYVQELDDILEERKQLISDAKQDGVPRKEINTAIKMLKQDIDPTTTTEVYTDIADLI